MPIETIEFGGEVYPRFQAEGFAAQFAIPFAKHVCKGRGVDVGCGKMDWRFPGAYPVDPQVTGTTATTYPYRELDYVFSSHCLEHLPNWVEALEYWRDSLKPGGVLFLYLPDYSQLYWRPWNNRKHLHAFSPTIINDALIGIGMANVFVSCVDLNRSFMAMAERPLALTAAAGV